jgi:hypothetical protein
LWQLHVLGAKIILQTNANLAPLFANSSIIDQIIDVSVTPTGFDYWVMIMSIPGVLGMTYESMDCPQSYLSARSDLVSEWAVRFGPKKRLRVGFCWSGRPDSWINRHKAMQFADICSLIERNPTYEWVNLQVECSEEQASHLETLGVKRYPGQVRSFADTAAIIHHMDVVISVDTAVGHLAGALGRPVWLALNAYGTDWRYLLDRDSSPWYSSMRLFRQPTMGDWASVTERIHKFLGFFKI